MEKSADNYKKYVESEQVYYGNFPELEDLINDAHFAK